MMVALSWVFTQSLEGQTYYGQLRDRVTEEPISMATVILLSADSTVVSTTLSSDGGTFELSGEGAHWLQVNHLAYQTLRVSLMLHCLTCSI